MKNDPFKGPGSEDLKRILGKFSPDYDPKSKPPQPPPDLKKPSNQTKVGGAGKPHAKINSKEQAEEEADEEDRKRKANTPEPEKPVDRTVVKITNLAWDREKVSIGGTVFISMDVAIPPEHAHATKITCRLEQQMPSGSWNAVTAHFKPCNAKDGKAQCELNIPEPLKKEDGSASVRPFYRPIAKHAYSKEAHGPRIEVVPGDAVSPYDSVIFYSPVRQEYLCFDTEEEYKSLVPELDLMNGLQGLTRKALEEKNPDARKKIKEEIEARTEELFDEEIIGDAKGAVEELLLIRRNPTWGKTGGWVYIRPYAKKNKTDVKGHWRKDSDATLKKNLEDLLKKAPGSKEHSPLFEHEYKAKLFETDPLKSQKMLWGKKKDNGTKDGEGFTFTREAAVCRFAMNFTLAEGSVNLKKNKVHIGSSGSLSFGLFDGKVEGKYPLPDKGVNFLTFLKRTTNLDAFIKAGRTCMLRLNVNYGAKAFAGFTISEALNLPEIDLSKEKRTGKKKEGGRAVSVGGSADTFAGIEASAEVAPAVQWARKPEDKFESLGSGGVEGGVSAGAGGHAECKVEYKNGTFHIKAGAGLTYGLGCKGSLSFELNVEEGFHFIGYLLNSADFHYVVEIERAAFDAYKNYAFTLMTLGHKALTSEKAVVVDVITNFSVWLKKKVDLDLQNVKRSLFESASAQGTLSNVPPEALGQALITIMQTREQDDFRSILSILNSTLRWNANVKIESSANHKLKWTLRSVSGVAVPDVDGPETDPKKVEALKKGIQIIEEFGSATGHWAGMDGQNYNTDFMLKFHSILKINGVF